MTQKLEEEASPWIQLANNHSLLGNQNRSTCSSAHYNFLIYLELYVYEPQTHSIEQKEWCLNI